MRWKFKGDAGEARCRDVGCLVIGEVTLLVCCVFGAGDRDTFCCGGCFIWLLAAVAGAGAVKCCCCR